jgi:hypothetical protein
MVDDKPKWNIKNQVYIMESRLDDASRLLCESLSMLLEVKDDIRRINIMLKELEKK